MKKLITALLSGLLFLSNTAVVSAEEIVPESDETILDSYELNPDTLHVNKLGETDDVHIAEEMEPHKLGDKVRVSIVLDGNATLDAGYDTENYVQNKAAQDYRAQLKAKQDQVTKQIEAVTGETLDVKWNLTYAVNIISANVKYGDLVKIKNVNGVKDVFLENRYEAQEDEINTSNTSSAMVGASATWNLGYTGAGMKVAIIDTGIDTSHQSFNGDALMYSLNRIGKSDAALSQSEAEALARTPRLNGSGKYYSAKVPFGYNYVDKNNTDITHLNDTEGEHGSHVAGIAAANRYIKSGNTYVDAAESVKAVGMAPDAQLFVMKVFGSNGGAYDSDYMAAIEDAMAMGCDVVNLSLGSSSPGFTYSSGYQEVLNNLISNNKLVAAISAGNAGALADNLNTDLYIDNVSMHTGGSPGSFINSLGVASADNIGSTGSPLVFNGSQNVYYNEGSASNASSMVSAAGSYSFVYIDSLGSADDYSTVNSAEALRGKVVIVNRGSLSFVEKGNNAVSYSPKALLIANNQPGTIGMALDDYTGTFPMALITLADANLIKENSTKKTAGSITYYTGNVQITSDVQAGVSEGVSRENAIVSDFSSWGVPGSLIMKPEITAPGGNIYSVYGTNKTTSGSTAGGSDQYEIMSGTSMAAPHMAGLSAVLSQYLDENKILENNSSLLNGYTRRALNQSLLMSTATPMKDADGNYISILHQGAGLVDVSKAVNTAGVSVIMMSQNDGTLTDLTNAAKDGKVKAELGDNPDRTSPYTYSFTVYNLSDQDVTYTLDTDLFTQDHYNDGEGHEFMAYETTMEGINEWNVSYAWEGMAGASHDANKDGTTDSNDVQSILEYVVMKTADPDYSMKFDTAAADLSDDGSITSEDAYLLISWLEKDHSVAEGTVPAKSRRAVTVTITPKNNLDDIYTSGLYVEGFTSVSASVKSEDGGYVDVKHTIPVLGFYGSWTDPSMFDSNSYIDTLYGTEKVPYSGKTSNYMTVQYNGTTTKFSGNPYMVEKTFPAERLAINSNSQIGNVYYNLIRSAGTTGYAVSKIDQSGNVTNVLSSGVTGNGVTGLWYYESQGAWQNTGTKTYSFGKTPSSYGLKEGDLFRIGFYAVPEYNGLLVSEDMTNENAGYLTSAAFRNVLESNVLGNGAFIGYDFKVDNTAPVINDAVLNDNELTVSASDNANLAYVAVLSLDGNVKYAEQAPGRAEYTITLDASEAIAEAEGYVAVFAGDYAGNETARAIKVNDKTSSDQTIYVLSDTLSAGGEYLIVSANTSGNGYALGHNNASSARDPVTIKAGNNLSGNAVYIDSSDVDQTSVWTVGSGYTFKNGNYYLNRSSSSLNFSTSSGNWTWNSTSHRLYQSSGNRSYYLRYYNNAFSISTSTNSIYLYEKRTIEGAEVDPYTATDIEVTPGTLDLYKGNEADLNAKVLPLTAQDRTVTWTSSNTSVASVDENGHVSATGAGNATITASANGSDSIKAQVSVAVASVNKNLNGIVWDEEGGVYFSSFNTSGLPSYTKLHNEGAGKELVSAMMYSSSALYAATLDTASASTVIYSVNRSNYALTEYGTNYLYATDMAVGASGSTYKKYIGFAYTFGPYLVAGPIEPGDDGEGGTYSGLPYAATNCSETTGDAYFAGIACKSQSSMGGSYYVLDENGVIWESTLSYSSQEFSFSTPTKVVETGIGTSFLYQNLYFDGTYLYWSHYADNVTEMIIINPSTKTIYHAGNFGEGVWPVGGMYVNGSVAPASVEDEVMSEELPADLKPVASREELMTEEVMNRFNVEAAKFNGTQSYGSTNSIKNRTSSEHRTRNTDQLTVSVNNTQSTDENNTETVSVAISENKETHYGFYKVAYDPSVLTFLNNNSGSAFSYAHADEKNGVVYIAYADGTGISANTKIDEVTFSAPEEKTVVTVTAVESEIPDTEEQSAEYILGGEQSVLTGASLSLNGLIGLNFYLTVPQSELDDTVVVLRLGTSEKRINAWEVSANTGENNIRIQCPLHAKQTRDKVVLSLEDKNGYRKGLYSQSGTDYTNGFRYSVADYINTVSKMESTGTQLKELLNALDVYGQWAQKQFNYDADTVNPDEISDIRAADLAEYAQKTSGELTEVSLGASLSLNSGTNINVYAYLPAGADVSKYRFSINGTAVTPVYDSTEKAYVFKLINVHAKNLGTAYTFRVEKDGVSRSVEYSALSYAYTILDMYDGTGKENTLVNTMKALYTYGKKAEAYFNK